jgi:hypothetical protein
MKRKIIARYRIVFAALFFAANSNFVNATNHAERSVRYPYCNVYLETACFGIAQGDQLKTEIPADFVLYNLDLAFGVHALIYSGFHPEPVSADWIVVQDLHSTDTVRLLLLSRSTDVYRLIYQKKEDDTITDVQLSGVSKENYGEVNSFIHNFRECHSEGMSVSCSDKRLFMNIEIGRLTRPRNTK